MSAGYAIYGAIAQRRTTDLEMFLRSTAWARQLPPQAVERIVLVSREARIKRGQTIVQAGDGPRHWVGIIDGLAVHQVTDRDGRQTSLAAARPGDWFGEGTLLRRQPWQFDTVARKDSRVALVPVEAFLDLVESNLLFSQHVARLLNDRLSQCMALLVAERTAGCLSRMARSIVRLVGSSHSSQADHTVRINQTELGLLAGMSRQRANEALGRLQADGLIEVRKGMICVVDMVRLAAV